MFSDQQAQLDGDSEEADVAHREGRGHSVQRRAAEQDHRSVFPRQLPTHHKLRMVGNSPSPNHLTLAHHANACYLFQ